MGLRSYFKKRSFDHTPEPKGKLKHAPAKKLVFVVHKHHASQLHYDLRLELDGVLKSWAVPKGPSMDPAQHHLAVHVEDHPFEYRTFEGIIPEGNYGAGEVIIWDKGVLTARQAKPGENSEAILRREYKKGHLTFILHGQKLKGEFALIKMQGRDKNAWLLVKKGDEYATTADITKADRSVVSDQTIEELASTAEPWHIYPKRALPRRVTPMLATLVEEPFNRQDWLFEIKWDGYRAIGSNYKGEIELYSRNQLDFRHKYPAIVEALRALKTEVVLDGEIVTVDTNGTPHFEWLQSWTTKPQGELRYYVFDILWYQGHDIREMPLSERKKLLRSIIPAHSLLTWSDHVLATGTTLFAAAKRQGLEGIIAKKAASTYQDGMRTGNWLKIKTHRGQEVVIGGFTEGRGSRRYLGALILGLYAKGELQYVGHANAGMAEAQRKQLRKKLDSLERRTSPFKIEPKPNAPVHWVRPALVGEVSFSEWTTDGRMRQPEFKGLRPDKAAREVHRERSHSPVSRGHIPKVSRVATPPPSRPTVGGSASEPAFTHLDKPFFPEAGHTKGDLITYYRTVAPIMLPYLLDRPHSLNRQPGGYKDRGFFQKNITFHLPKFGHVHTVHSDSTNEDVRYLVCKNTDTLLYMAQLGCIEINPWSSRVGKLEHPDWAVMDLDPEGVTFKDVITVATTVHKVCQEWGIACYPKTSGKTGIHVFIPLAAAYTYAQARDFVHLIAIEVNKRQPTLTSLERSPAKRQHRIYLDYLQNSKGQTLAAPYSVRPTPQANVSAPLHWDEVKSSLKPSDFTIKNMPRRIASHGDLWKPVAGKGVDIAAILRHLG